MHVSVRLKMADQGKSLIFVLTCWIVMVYIVKAHIDDSCDDCLLLCTACSIIGDTSVSYSSSDSNSSLNVMPNPAYLPIVCVDGLSTKDLMSTPPLPQTLSYFRPLPPLDLPRPEDMHVEHSTVSSVQESTATSYHKHSSQRPRALERCGTPELESSMLWSIVPRKTTVSIIIFYWCVSKHLHNNYTPYYHCMLSFLYWIIMQNS